MGGGSGRGPSQIGGISGQGGGRILPGTGGGVGEIFLVSPRLTATAAPGYPDYRPDPLYGEPIVTVFAAPGGGPGQSGKGDLFTVFTALKTDGTVTPITSSSGGGGGWGAAGGTGPAPSSVALEVVAGGNPGAAELSGINTRMLTVKVFALMGFLCALSAVVASARLSNHTNDIGTLDELRVIAAAVIGGTALAGGIGTIYGAILGALIMQSLQSGMAMVGVDAPFQNIVVGAVLVLAVLLDIIYRKKTGAK